MTTIAARVADLRERIADACARAGRREDDVTLIAVTKGHGVAAIDEARAAGVRDFGENRVQEAAPKIAELRARGVSARWHLIGHLQRNKARDAVRLFDLIHSVDSEGLAEAVSKEAERAGKVQRVLIQVKLSPEETKTGVGEYELPSLLNFAAALPWLSIEGFMGMPPYSEHPEDTRPYFRRLREIRDGLRHAGLELRELSMGMSHDFEVAIEEGATLVRVGTSIFGERNP